MRERGLLHGRRLHLHPAARGAVGLRDHERDLMPGATGRPQAWAPQIAACRRRPASFNLQLRACAHYHSPFFCSFLILRSDEVSLQAADAVDKEHTVEVVDLVLEGAGEQFFAFHLEPLAVLILGPHLDPCGARAPFREYRAG